MQPDSHETRSLLEEIGRGDRTALGRLLERHRPKLIEFVDCHFDPELRARLDPSDLVQEAQAEITRRVGDYLQRRPMPFSLWLRKTAYERLLKARRNHLRARRSVRREQRWPDRSSMAIAGAFLGRGPSPSQQAQSRELARRVGEALTEIAEADREILLMRHAESLPYEEIALLLDIDSPAARKRYGRALIRLQKVLTDRGILESPDE